jgi:hypothetical protein
MFAIRSLQAGLSMNQHNSHGRMNRPRHAGSASRPGSLSLRTIRPLLTNIHTQGGFTMTFRMQCLSALVLGALTASLAPAQDKKADMNPAEAEMMKKWQAFMTPGEGHKKLDWLAGNWEANIQMWMDPGKPPSESKGTESGSLILGGRYLQSATKSTMMGMPFEGQGTMGYDNFRKKYFFTWIDNFGTGVTRAEGTLDPSGKILTLYGRMDEPTTGEIDKPVKYVYRFEGADKHIFEIHDLDMGGEAHKVMEITYTRKK